MKRFYKIALGLSASVVLSSCAKYEDVDFHVDKPVKFANQEILDAYEPLKSYLNPQANTDFKLGLALSLPQYVNKGVMYRLANSNFNEIVLGYEMKHGAVVQSDGKLNLANVKNLLNAAKSAGIAVYGHTLTWHANQNAAYLNKLIAPLVIPGTTTPTWDVVTAADFETASNTNYESNTNAQLSFTTAGQGAGGQGRAIKITNAAVRTNDYDAQFFLKFSPAVKAGEQYELSMDVKADQDVSFPTQAHIIPYSYKHNEFFGSITANNVWSKFTKRITITDAMATSGALAFNLGKFATSFYFDNITLKKYNEKGSGNAGYAYTFTNTAVTNFWESQVAYDLPTLTNNKVYVLKFSAKGSAAGAIRAELQSSSNFSSNSFGQIALGTGWKDYEIRTTTTADNRNRLLFSFGDYLGTVSVDNIKLTPEDGTTSIVTGGDFESGVGAWVGWGGNSSRGLSAQGQGYGGAQDQIIEKTPAEKKVIIKQALTQFISGMVDSCKTVVKAWDVVNEPMDDGRPYELKTGVGRTTIAPDEFFWQDYLGKDYAVDAFKLAMQHGNPDDKLFINDYNLEYNLDKCKGLIEYVNYIEGKGARVDGIGTQMHISTTSDKQKIVDMFTLLAATGKLIKVSELDMGIANKKTAEATELDYKEQAEMYKFVIEKYFEIIPASQRYGITIWSATDSPTNSSWRAGEPIGLWTEGLIRKPAYMGVAEGLKGK